LTLGILLLLAPLFLADQYLAQGLVIAAETRGCYLIPQKQFIMFGLCLAIGPMVGHLHLAEQYLPRHFRWRKIRQ